MQIVSSLEDHRKIWQGHIETASESSSIQHPTQRAPDLGYAPRFLSMFLALAASRFERESSLPPPAGNASRCAASLLNHFGIEGVQFR